MGFLLLKFPTPIQNCTLKNIKSMLLHSPLKNLAATYIPIIKSARMGAYIPLTIITVNPQVYKSLWLKLYDSHFRCPIFPHSSS